LVTGTFTNIFLTGNPFTMTPNPVTPSSTPPFEINFFDTTLSGNTISFQLGGTNLATAFTNLQIYDGTTCYHILDGAIYLGTRTPYSSSPPSTILLGAETTGGSSVNWIGDIATTTFYSKVLTAAEVLQNYNATK
jgi:hypothetical protein